MSSAAELRLRTNSPSETAAIASVLGELAEGGDVLLLSGDLGAGKTTFTKAYGAALGVTEPITSPTFTLAREYEGRLLLHHLDVYRLGSLAEAADLALPELVEGGGVVVIEWGETVEAALLPDYLLVAISFGDGDDDREFSLLFVGPRWINRRVSIENKLGAWLAC